MRKCLRVLAARAVVDGAELVVGGVATDGVVLVDPAGHRCAALLPGGEAVIAQQFELEGGTAVAPASAAGEIAVELPRRTRVS